jgi:hypothetical protein
VFSNIQIANFRNSVVKKYIGRLDVSVDYVSLMQFEKPLQAVVSNIPNIDFGNSGFCGYGFFYFTLQVPLVGKLHNYTQFFGGLIIEGLFVVYDISIVNRG